MGGLFRLRQANGWAGLIAINCRKSAADELNYTPNRWAQGLRLQESKTVAYLLPDILNPHYMRTARMLEEELPLHGYELLIEESKMSLKLEKTILTHLIDANIDGLFGSILSPDCEELLGQFAKQNKPSLFLGGGNPMLGDVFYTDHLQCPRIDRSDPQGRQLIQKSVQRFMERRKDFRLTTPFFRLLLKSI